jgi:hypothetical protein
MDKLYPEEFENIFGVDDPNIDVEEKKKGDDGSDAKDSDAPVIRLVSMILTEAVKMRASDIHLEPMERTFRVRYRIDGVLREMDTPPKRLQAAIIGQQQESFAVGVQPSGGVDAGQVDELRQSAPASGRSELAGDAPGLVEEQKTGGAGRTGHGRSIAGQGAWRAGCGGVWLFSGFRGEYAP